MKKNETLRSVYPWGSIEWTKRTKIIASRIPAGAKVIDLGGGYGTLLKYLDQPGSYTSVDLQQWTDKTIVADFNKGEFPEIPEADIIVAQGILEYIDKPLEFLEKIHKYGSQLFLSYREKQITEKMVRNDYTLKEVEQFLKESGWLPVASRSFGETKIFFTKQNYEDSIHHPLPLRAK